MPGPSGQCTHPGGLAVGVRSPRGILRGHSRTRTNDRAARGRRELQALRNTTRSRTGRYRSPGAQPARGRIRGIRCCRPAPELHCAHHVVHVLGRARGGVFTSLVRALGQEGLEPLRPASDCDAAPSNHASKHLVPQRVTRGLVSQRLNEVGTQISRIRVTRKNRSRSERMMMFFWFTIHRRHA